MPYDQSSYSKEKRKPLARYLRWTFLSALSGVLSGAVVSFFLIFLEVTTRTRDAHPQIIWLLPLGGFAIGWFYWRHGKDVAGGSNLILDEIHDPKKVTPARMAPTVLGATIVTHLFGGSAGREGAAVQIAASLSDQLSRFFKIEPEERKILLISGAGAGFGAALAAPWAGVIFGMEVINIGKLRFFAFFECFIASFVAVYTTHLLPVHHTHYPAFEVPAFTWRILFMVGIAGIAFGLAARAFVHTTHLVEKLQARFVSYPPLKPVIAGFILLALYWLEGTYNYVGLGLPLIQDSIVHPAGFREPILKTVFTAITVGSGFKGGEFVPLVFIGATLGSALGAVLSVSFSLLAAMGFAAVFAGAANTPIACTVMAIEYFGWRAAPYAIVACYVSYYCSGHHGLYHAQRVYAKKHERVRAGLVWLGELPRRFLNNGA